MPSSEIKQYAFRPSDRPEVEVVDLRELTAAHGPQLTSPHRTGFYHLLLIDDEAPVHMVDFEPVQVTPYTLLCIDRQRVHQFDRHHAYSGLGLIFTEAFFCVTESDARFLRNNVLFNDVRGGQAPVPLGPAHAHFRKLFGQVASERASMRDDLSHPLLKNMVHNILLLAEREKRKHVPVRISKGPDLELALRFRDLLEKHFLKEKNVAFYARRLNITEKRLGMATKRTLGILPKEVISDRIMLEARRRLVHDDVQVKNVAFELGFEEPTNFIKYFKQRAGSTPAEFRERQLARS